MDPRLVPPLRFANVWPAVPEGFLRADCIRQALPKAADVESGLLQGDSHWSHDAPAREAAVLLGLIPRSAGLSVLLTQRPQSMPTHAGQIAFPGGKLQSDDASPEAAAIREAQEEVGLDPRQLNVLGCLPAYCTRTGFRIHPVVALLHEQVVLRADPREVDDMFEVPLAFLMNGRFHHMHRAQREGKTWSWWSMPYQQPLETGNIERFIWGATAGMIRNLYLVMLHHANQSVAMTETQGSTTL